MTREYSEAAAEVLDILDHTSKYKVNLIPTKFINYLKENATKDYVVELDYSKPINEMNVKAETMGILSTICKNWWWSQEEKQEYARLVRDKEIKHQEELREKYNPDDIFKKRKEKIVENNSQQEIESSNEIVIYKESIIKRIINKIINLFRQN